MRAIISIGCWVYVWIGALFGFILEGSYLWGSTIGSPANIGIVGHLLLFVFANIVGVAKRFLPDIVVATFSDLVVFFLRERLFSPLADARTFC
jgi:hypothetical protein